MPSRENLYRQRARKTDSFRKSAVTEPGQELPGGGLRTDRDYQPGHTNIVDWPANVSERKAKTRLFATNSYVVKLSLLLSVTEKT